jgi:hypothetical protein
MAAPHFTNPKRSLSFYLPIKRPGLHGTPFAQISATGMVHGRMLFAQTTPQESHRPLLNL